MLDRRRNGFRSRRSLPAPRVLCGAVHDPEDLRCGRDGRLLGLPGAALSLKISTAARAGLAAVAVAGASLGRAEVPVVAVVLFILVVACSTANQLFTAARAKAVQRFVRQELRGSASSLSMTVLTALSIASASLGPFAFSLAGLEVCLLLITGLFAVGAALAFAGFPRNGRGDDLPQSTRAGFLTALVEGWKVAWTVRRLRVVLLGSVLYGVPLGVNNVALVLLWVDTKGGTLIDYGIGSSLFGVGGFVGAVAAHRLVNRGDLHRLFAASLGALGVSYALLAWVPDHAVSFGLMFVSGFLFSLYAVVQSPILLEAAPAELTGRVVSTTASVAALSSLAAAVVVALLFALPGAGGLLVPWAVCLGGGVTVLGGALLLFRGRDTVHPASEAVGTVQER